MHHRALNILLLLLSLTISILVAEGLLGIYLVKSLARYPLPPYAVQRHETGEYSVQYGYNNLSLRGMDYDPGLTYDLLLFGDSFFFGQGVAEEKTFAARLQQKGLKILNTAEIATNPIDYLHKFKVLKSHDVKAQKIVIGLCMGNDFQDIADKNITGVLNYPYRPAFLRYGAAEFFRLERLRYQVRKKWLTLGDWWQCRVAGQVCRETAIVHEFEYRKRFYEDWLRFFTDDKPELMAAMVRGGGGPAGGQLSEDDYLRQMQLSDASLEQIVQILLAIQHAAGKTPLYVILIPARHYVLGFRSVRYDRLVARLSDSLQPAVAVIDLHGVMTPADHFPRDGHWNESGHQVMADVLLKRVLSEPPHQ
jgi:hypothetical protein